MNFNSEFFITLLATGLCVLVVGWFFLKYPPRKINGIYGYRSRRSKSSQEAWDFSQPISARLMMASGLLMTVISVIGCFMPLDTKIQLGAALIVLVAFVVLLYIRTEQELKRQFPSG